MAKLGSLLALLAAAGSKADLPVHCVHRQIIGKWSLLLGENDGDSSATCNHAVPDKIMVSVEKGVSARGAQGGGRVGVP